MRKKPSNLIGWCDMTLNPIKGKCQLNCFYCYATKFYDRFGWDPTVGFKPEVFQDADLDNLEPSRIFICSTHEIFGDWIPSEWIQEILGLCRSYPQHTFQLLTKLPGRAREFKFPRNVWLGTTVTWSTDIVNINNLAYTREIAVRYISFEPLMEDIFPAPISRTDLGSLATDLYKISWIIVGAMTGPYRKKYFPDPKWIQNILKVARLFNIPVFLKDNLYLKDSMIPVQKIQEFPGGN